MGVGALAAIVGGAVAGAAAGWRDPVGSVRCL